MMARTTLQIFMSGILLLLSVAGVPAKRESHTYSEILPVTTSPETRLRVGEPDTLPGWLGDVHTVPNLATERQKVGLRGAERPKGGLIDLSRIKVLSMKPRAFLYEGFLSDEECDHIINMAIPRLERSSVADSTSGESVVSEIRTSSGMFIDKGEDEVIQRVEDRIAAWTFLPKPNQEALQVLRYDKNQKYEPHWDYFSDDKNLLQGGHRYATVLMYLNDVKKGGETVFPNAQDSNPKDDTWSECGKLGLGVKPRKGDALLFFSLHPDGTPDPSSLHYACPVEEGIKWSAPKWIHVKSFDNEPITAAGCSDRNDRCEEWAAMGECQKNPAFMIGHKGYSGSCRRSCNACTDAAAT